MVESSGSRKAFVLFGIVLLVIAAVVLVLVFLPEGGVPRIYRDF